MLQKCAFRHFWPIYRLTASLGPIKALGSFILDDDAARELVRELTAVQNNPEVWTRR
jgi:hypothetical protein